MNNWRASTWGDEISLEYGKAIRGYQNAVGAVPVYGTNGPVGWTDEPLFPAAGVILGRKGAYRGVHFSSIPFHVIDTAYYVVPKTDLDMRWLYYAIKYHGLGEIDDGSPIPSTTRAAVYVRDFNVPSKTEQLEMAGILSALDDKIELNRRMNETLEAQARALFRDWFVDFGPVKAKMAGDTPYLAPDLWSLFPNRLDDDGVPEGWQQRSIYDFAEVIYGAPFASSRFNADGVGRPLARIRDLTAHVGGQFTDEVHKKETLIQPGSIVVGMDGEFRTHLWHGVPTLMNQRICSFQPSTPSLRGFVFFGIEPLLILEEAAAIGTTVIHLGKKDIDRFELLGPDPDILAAFASIVEPMLDKIVANGQQNRTLAQIRDLLLPKLMSGEIRVGEGAQ